MTYVLLQCLKGKAKTHCLTKSKDPIGLRYCVDGVVTQASSFLELEGLLYLLCMFQSRTQSKDSFCLVCPHVCYLTCAVKQETLLNVNASDDQYLYSARPLLPFVW